MGVLDAWPLHHPEGQVLIGPLQIESDWLHPFVGIAFPINLFKNTRDHLAYIGRSKIHLENSSPRKINFLRAQADLGEAAADYHQ